MLDAPTRLRNAVISGNLAITKRLLSRFPDLWLNIDSLNNGWSNLHYAAHHGHYLICFHLVSMKNKYKRDIPGYGSICDIDLVTFDNLTVLHMPIANHYSQTLHYLLQAFSGSKWLNQKGGPEMRTPLLCCCASNFIEGLNLFLEFGADWSFQDSNGDTCLHICFAKGTSASIQELVKGITTRKTSQILSAYYEASAGKEDVVPPSLTAIVQMIYDELGLLESTLNNRGFTAVDQALSDLVVSQYQSQKTQWIINCVENELALHDTAASVISSANLKCGSFFGRPRVLSISSSFTSSLINMGKAVLCSSPESETPPPQSAIVFDSDLFSGRDILGSAKTIETASSGRKHLSSLPSASQPENVVAQVGFAKIPQIRKNSKSFGYGYRISPGQMRTPILNLLQANEPISPPPLEFARTQSLKSITISPLSRHNKRNEEDNLTEEPELELLSGMSNSSVVSNTSSRAVSPTSFKLLSKQFFSPLSRLRSASATYTADTSHSNGEDVVVPKPDSNRSIDLLIFKRNFSTPAFSLELVSGGDVSSPKKGMRSFSVEEPASTPPWRLFIPEAGTSGSQNPDVTFPPSVASASSDDAFESSPSTLTPFKIKPLFTRSAANRVDSILESSEESLLFQAKDSINSISFTRVRGDL